MADFFDAQADLEICTNMDTIAIAHIDINFELELPKEFNIGFADHAWQNILAANLMSLDCSSRFNSDANLCDSHVCITSI